MFFSMFLGLGVPLLSPVYIRLWHTIQNAIPSDLQRMHFTFRLSESEMQLPKPQLLGFLFRQKVVQLLFLKKELASRQSVSL